MSDDRPDPERLLAAAKASEAPKRGRLKVFLGAAAGVGKLAALLDADTRPRTAPPAASRYPSRPTTRPSESTRQPRSKRRGVVRVGEGGHYPSHSETVERPSHAPLGFLDRSA